MFVGYLFVIVLLSMCPSANSELLLDKQIENHFQKYLEERNCFEGIEHLGGPYLRVQYSKSVQEDITTFAYVRPLGVPGDPNQVSIKTYVLNAPVRIGLNEIETLQKAGSSPVFSQDDSPIFDALFETFKSIKIACSQQWRKNDRVVLITSDAEGNIVKKSVEDAIYYCGIEQIATDTWQLYFRRGHRIFESDELSGHIEFSPLTIIPADIVAIKSGMRPATNRGREEWKTEFFLYGQFDEAKLTDLWGTLRGNRIPAAAIKFDGHAAAVVYCQKHNAAPFGHPYFNAVVYSVILTQHKGMFTIHSLSAIIEEIPEGIRRGYTHVEVLLDKPPIDVVEKAVQKMVWPSWCNPLVDTDVTWEDRQKICELYLRVPHWEINYPEIEVEKDDILKVKVFPQETGDFGRPTLTLLKINDIWRIYFHWSIDDFWLY